MFARIFAVRRLPQLTVSRVRLSSSFKEGSVAQSKGFKGREESQERAYALQRDEEKLQKLRADINEKKTQLDQLQQEHEAELHKHDKA